MSSKKSLKIGIQMDHISTITIGGGSTFALALEAQARGHELYHFTPDRLQLRGGKVSAQDRAVERARGELLAFSDANSRWDPDALAHLVAPFAANDVAYVCGEVTFLGRGGSNQEGVYWRYENAVRRLESRLAGITAGNGAIYAVRREDYLHLDPRTSHDLSFPSALVRRGPDQA